MCFPTEHKATALLCLKCYSDSAALFLILEKYIYIYSFFNNIIYLLYIIYLVTTNRNFHSGGMD